jgi:2-oxoisovalerate dehydrogenase E1 component alpha subunit
MATRAEKKITTKPSAKVAKSTKAVPLQILNPDGSIVKGKTAPEIPEDDLKRLFATIVLNREIDERMLTVQRQGRIGFYMQSRGEEASILAPAYVTTSKDWLFLCYRELSSLLWRGFTLQTFCNQLYGNQHDLVKGRQMPCHYSDRDIGLVSISSPVSTQIPQAAGVGWAMRLKGEQNVSVCFMGEGGTSEGDFHVGLNFAAVYRANTLFVCRNNGWAISTPASVQSASETFAQKAEAYGMPGVLVDGADLLAMIHASREAVERARKGGGPTLIEALTYRFSAHSSSDDPSVYRDEKAEAEKHQDKDPLARLRAYLQKKKLWSQGWEQELAGNAQQAIVAALKQAESEALPRTETVFEDVYAAQPWHLREQQAEALKYKQRSPHGAHT